VDIIYGILKCESDLLAAF